LIGRAYLGEIPILLSKILKTKPFLEDEAAERASTRQIPNWLMTHASRNPSHAFPIHKTTRQRATHQRS
jgi:hypothetical protein